MEAKRASWWLSSSFCSVFEEKKEKIGWGWEGEGFTLRVFIAVRSFLLDLSFLIFPHSLTLKGYLFPPSIFFHFFLSPFSFLGFR